MSVYIELYQSIFLACSVCRFRIRCPFSQLQSVISLQSIFRLEFLVPNETGISGIKNKFLKAKAQHEKLCFDNPCIYVKIHVIMITFDYIKHIGNSLSSCT